MNLLYRSEPLNFYVLPQRDKTKEPFRVLDESIFSEYTTSVLNLTLVSGIFLKRKPL